MPSDESSYESAEETVYESDVTRSVFQTEIDSILSVSSSDVVGNYEFYELDCGTVMLVMTEPCTLFFYGSASIRSLVGKVEILGYVLDPCKLPVQVYSCEGSSALYMSTVGGGVQENSDTDLSLFTGYGLSFMVATKIRNVVQSGGCVLLMDEPERKRHLRTRTGRAEKRFGFSLDTLRHRITNRFTVLPSLQIDIDSGVTVLCGGQGVGKSSSLRYLTNRTLNSVDKLLYLDLDIGQPEFTLQECVSAILVDTPIVGPSYTHFQKPVMSYNVGNKDASKCVDTYLQAVKLLVESCRSSYSDVPWLVNTMGFSKGVGVYLTTSCLAILQPSLVIQIEGAKSHNFPSDLSEDYVSSLCDKSVPKYKLLKVIKEFKICKDPNHSPSHVNKEVRWIATENYFSDELRPSYPLIIRAESLTIFNVTDKSVIPVNLYPQLVSKLITLSSSSSLNEPPSVLDFGVILAYESGDQEFTVLTPLDPTADTSVVESFLIGSLQIPNKLNKAPGPHTSGLIPYCLIRKSGDMAPTVRPLKRTYRFLFDPPSKSRTGSQLLSTINT